MGETLRLRSKADGFQFEAFHEPPRDARRGGLVMLHAIWGVTPHLRTLAGEFAEDGYEVLVPSLFERDLPGFAAVDIDEASRDQRRALHERFDWDRGMGDVRAAIEALAAPVSLLGFCFGGTAAWLAAARCEGLSAVASFYGGGVAAHRHETPRCPTILHFGRTDELIPPADVEAVREAHPDLPVFVYEAGHAFMAPNAYVEDCARLARLRTLQLFHRSAARAEMGS